MSNTTTTKSIHEELMEEEKLTVKDLPKSIQEKIKEYDKMNKEFSDETTDEEKEAPLIFSCEIANEIQDLLDAKEEEEKKVKKEKAENDKKAAAKTATPPAAAAPPAPAAEPATPPAAPKPAASKEKEVLAALDDKGCIHYEKLQEILGRSFGDTVKEGNLVLHNIYMTDYYQKAK